jgi:glutaredoxin
MSKKATIHRMVTPTHLCPWGIKAKDLLKRNGFAVEDRHLESMEANQAFNEEYGYEETPQIFIGGEHLGTYDDLREHLDQLRDLTLRLACS